MIVDDHAEMRRLLRTMLGELASEFTECADGAQAVAEFARQRPDWTIMDIAMQGMNGLEATRRILKQFAGTHAFHLGHCQNIGAPAAVEFQHGIGQFGQL